MLSSFESERHHSLLVECREHRSVQLLFDTEDDRHGKRHRERAISEGVAKRHERRAAARRRMKVDDEHLAPRATNGLLEFRM